MKASDVESTPPAEKDEHIGGGVGAIRDVINMNVNRIAAGVAVKRRQNANSHITRYGDERCDDLGWPMADLTVRHSDAGLDTHLEMVLHRSTQPKLPE